MVSDESETSVLRVYPKYAASKLSSMISCSLSIDSTSNRKQQPNDIKPSLDWLSA